MCHQVAALWTKLKFFFFSLQAGSEQSSDVYVLCQVGKRICNQSGKRKLAQIFDMLGDENDDFEAKLLKLWYSFEILREK